MIFKIKRTSGGNKKPCEEAFYQITDKGYIKRQDGMRSCWGIEITSLKELIGLSKKYGDLILNDSLIEIYDDYRE
jgi:hypothetical protein